jgi:hypothetical protein
MDHLVVFFNPLLLQYLYLASSVHYFTKTSFFFQLFFSNHSLSLMLNFILEIFFKFPKYLSDFFLLIHITIFPNYSPFSSLKLFLATMMVLFFIIFLSFRFCYTIFLFLIQRPNQFFFFNMLSLNFSFLILFIPFLAYFVFLLCYPNCEYFDFDSIILIIIVVLEHFLQTICPLFYFPVAFLL